MCLLEIASDEALETAYRWLCRQRTDWPADADVWALRFHWPEAKQQIRHDLVSGQYCFSPLSSVTRHDGQVAHLWSARDALVLKAMALVLGQRLSLSRACVHVKGHGGAKAAVRGVRDHLRRNNYACRTDVQSYYENIDHFIVLEKLSEAGIVDRAVLNLVWQSMRRTVDVGGVFRDIEHGLPRRSALSPLLGTLYLDSLDREMQTQAVYYVRFMGDIVILTRSRWSLRRAVKRLNEILAALRLGKHPDKTFIGRIEKGFDFLGYHFGTQALTVAKDTLKKFVEQATRLYERRGEAPSFDASPLGLYVRRWLRWASGGLGQVSRPRAAVFSVLPVKPESG